MAAYKVIQDIEAEDKLLGPLTLRQFIYAIIVILCGFVSFKLIMTKWFLALPFLPPMIFFAMLAAPFGHDQSSEVWLLAKVRFFLKPRLRIWDQSGLKELVTITAPKTLEKHLTDELSQTEVRSRLQALANTIDSRGWAVKNVNVNMFSEPVYASQGASSDRLLDPSTIPQDVPSYDVQATDDILDEQNNPTAQNLSQMVAASSKAVKQKAIDNMHTGAKQPQTTDPPADYWFLNGPINPAANITTPGQTTFVKSQVVLPGQPVDEPAAQVPDPTDSDEKTLEQALLDKIHTEKAHPNPSFSRLRTILPPSAQPPAQTDEPAVTSTPNRVNIELANNDDLNVATIQRQANKADRKKPPKDEVVVRLR